jgi:hypothetical protein
MLMKKHMHLQFNIHVLARLFFYSAYSFLFGMLLIDNIVPYANQSWMNQLGSILGMISCALLGFCGMCHVIYYKKALRQDRRFWKIWLVFFAIIALCFFLQDYSLLIVLCLILCASKERSTMLMKVSLYLGIGFVVLGWISWAMGSLPAFMELSSRQNLLHSSWLCVIFFFLQAYYLWAYANHLSITVLAGFSGLHFLAYLESNRLDLFLFALLMEVFAYLSSKKRNGNICSILEWVNLSIVPLYSFIGLIALDALGNKNAWYYPLFDGLNRLGQDQFLLAHYKMQTSGLHYISNISKAQYMSDGIILSSGYLNVLLSCGLILLLLYIFIAGSLTYKNQGKQVQLVVLLFVLLLACVQNTLMSCWMLPFICLSFPHGLLKKRKKGSPHFVMDSI